MLTAQEQLTAAFTLYDETVHAIAQEANDTLLVPYLAKNDLVFLGKSLIHHGICIDSGKPITWESVPQNVQDLFAIKYWNDTGNHFLSDLFPVLAIPA